MAGIGWGLPAVFEEAYPLKIAWRMGGFEEGSSFTLNPGFFRYPSLLSYLELAVLFALRFALALLGIAPDLEAFRRLYATDPTIFYLAGRGLVAVLGALTVIPAWHIARRARGNASALLACLLVALSPPLVEGSQRIETDVPMALFVTWALALCCDIAEGQERSLLGRSALAGALIGLAASFKYPGLLAILPLWLAVALRARGGRAAAPAGEAVAGTAAALLVLVATSPFLVLDARGAARDLAAEAMHQRLGHFGSDAGASWAFYARSWFSGAFGWLLGAFALLAMLRSALWKREGWAMISGAAVLAFVAAMGASAVKAERYLLPVIPAGLVFAATLLLGAARRLLRSPPNAAMAVGLAAICVLSDLPRWSGLARKLRADPRETAKAWIERTIPDGSMLVVEPYGPHVRSPLDGLSSPDVLGRFRARDSSGASRYWLVPLPLFQVGPERTAVYYEPALHARADAWVVTAAVRDRYRREPHRFRTQNAFYDWLDAHWPRIARFGSGAAGGSEIVIYRNPEHRVPFGQRVLPPPPPTPAMRQSAGDGGEAAFYFALGMNYYGYGRLREAAQSFRTALSFPRIAGGVGRPQLEEALRLSEAAPRPPAGQP